VAADYHSKAEVRERLGRYVRARLELTPHEVLVGGPPWNTVICTRFTDRATDAHGNVIYEAAAGRAIWEIRRPMSVLSPTTQPAPHDRTSV
jgi:hypothetical protein